MPLGFDWKGTSRNHDKIKCSCCGRIALNRESHREQKGSARSRVTQKSDKEMWTDGVMSVMSGKHTPCQKGREDS